ncbi:MAG: FtsW/RodA/SpoVE family cell cycle protein [Dehalococcoidia bacterium]
MNPGGLLARERNTELALLAGAFAFIALAWRSLDAAAITAPGGTGRIVTQFALSALAGNVALRIVAPRAPGQVYAVACFLTAVGLAFVIRLVPDSAQDQANWISFGVLVFACAAWLGTRHDILRRYTYTSGALALGLLVMTGLVGTTINGARLWITVGGQSIQTTELIKFFVVIFLAGFLAERGAVLASPRIRLGNRTYSNLPYLVPLIALLLATIAALALLKDLGSIALLVLLAVSMLVLATGRLRYLGVGLGILALTGAAGYFAFSHAQVRVDAWLHPGDDPAGIGYQALQSTYAIQAGGVTGEGLGLGQPNSIPAAATDYIFSAICEEIGFAGAIGVVLLYVLLLFAGLHASLRATNSFGRLLCTGISLLLAIQAAVIIAGNLRMIPTTGITLPFISYGGSSLVVNFALLGLLCGIAGARQSDSS